MGHDRKPINLAFPYRNAKRSSGEERKHVGCLLFLRVRSRELKEKTRAVRRRKRESSWPFFFPRGKRDHYLPRSPSASRFAGDASNAGAVTRAQLASRTGASRDLASCRMPSAECRVHGGKALCSRTAIEPPSAHTHPICFPPRTLLLSTTGASEGKRERNTRRNL